MYNCGVVSQPLGRQSHPIVHLGTKLDVCGLRVEWDGSHNAKITKLLLRTGPIWIYVLIFQPLVKCWEGLWNFDSACLLGMQDCRIYPLATFHIWDIEKSGSQNCYHCIFSHVCKMTSHEFCHHLLWQRGASSFTACCNKSLSIVPRYGWSYVNSVASRP